MLVLRLTEAGFPFFDGVEELFFQYAPAIMSERQREGLVEGLGDSRWRECLEIQMPIDRPIG